MPITRARTANEWGNLSGRNLVDEGVRATDGIVRQATNMSASYPGADMTFDMGLYRCVQPIVIDTNTGFVGSGRINIEGKHNATTLNSGSGDDIFQITSVGNSTSISMRGFRFTTGAVADTPNPITGAACIAVQPGGQILDSQFTDFYVNGIEVFYRGGSISNRFSGMTFDYMSAAAFVHNKSNFRKGGVADSHFYGCALGAFRIDGEINPDGSTVTATQRRQGIGSGHFTISGCSFDRTYGSVLAVAGASSFTFNGQPLAGDTVTINGVVFTFVNSGAAGAQSNIGATVALTMSNLVTVLNASADAAITPMTYASDGVATLSMTVDVAGVAGNAYLISSSTANIVANGPTTSTYTLTGLPSNGDTITINDEVITFVTSGATGLQVNIGATAAITTASLLTLLQSAGQNTLKVFTYTSPTTTTILCRTKLSDGTSFATTESAANLTVNRVTSGGGAVFGGRDATEQQWIYWRYGDNVTISGCAGQGFSPSATTSFCLDWYKFDYCEGFHSKGNTWSWAQRGMYITNCNNCKFSDITKYLNQVGASNIGGWHFENCNNIEMDITDTFSGGTAFYFKNCTNIRGKLNVASSAKAAIVIDGGSFIVLEPTIKDANTGGAASGQDSCAIYIKGSALRCQIINPLISVTSTGSANCQLTNIYLDATTSQCMVRGGDISSFQTGGIAVTDLGTSNQVERIFGVTTVSVIQVTVNTGATTGVAAHNLWRTPIQGRTVAVSANSTSTGWTRPPTPTLDATNVTLTLNAAVATANQVFAVRVTTEN